MLYAIYENDIVGFKNRFKFLSNITSPLIYLIEGDQEDINDIQKKGDIERVIEYNEIIPEEFLENVSYINPIYDKIYVLQLYNRDCRVDKLINMMEDLASNTIESNMRKINMIDEIKDDKIVNTMLTLCYEENIRCKNILEQIKSISNRKPVAQLQFKSIQIYTYQYINNNNKIES